MAKINKRASAKQPAKKAASPGKPETSAKKKKLWIVPVLMVAALAGVGIQIYMRSKYLASLKFDTIRFGSIVAQGRDQGQAVALVGVVGDKADNAFVLEDDGANPRVQRFDPMLSPKSLVYKPGTREESLIGPLDLDVDPKGQVYVLLKDGRVLVLSNELKFLSQFKTGLQGVSAITVNSAGRVYVASAGMNKVVFFTGGVKEGEFGAPGTQTGDLANPFRMRATADDEVLVIERADTGLRGKIFSAGHGLRKVFLIDNIQVCEPVRLGVNAQNIAFLNDHLGSRGVLAYDIKTGKFFGETQVTKDGQKFVSPGATGANRYSNSFFVHSVVGLIKCQLPPMAAGEK